MSQATDDFVHSGISTAVKAVADSAVPDPAVPDPAVPDAGAARFVMAEDQAARPLSPVVFDQAGFADRMMNDEDFMRDVMREFLRDTPGQIADLRNLIDSGDAREAGRRAHQIKGAAANVGGEALRALASAIEEAGGAGDLEPMMAAIDALELEFVRLGNAMNEALQPASSQDTGHEAMHECAP